MTAGGDGDHVSAARDNDEANIRWLLAAVLRHQPEEEPREDDA